MSKEREDKKDRETLDEKIRRIRKKNEEIEKRRLEVEADKQTAAKLNALVQLTAPKEEWPLPRSYSPEERRGRKQGSLHDKNRQTAPRNLTHGDEANRPPPDPAYRFLADADRDPVLTKPPERPQLHSRNRGHGITRGQCRSHKSRQDAPPSVRGTPVYEAWRAERNRIDEERIQRQRTAQGQWRREWDCQKSDEEWKASCSERKWKSNSVSNRPTHPNVWSEAALKDVKKNIFSNGNGVQLENHKGNCEKVITSSHDETAKSSEGANEHRSVQSQGNSLHVSFVNESSGNKAVLPPAGRKHVVGSGRLVLPQKAKPMLPTTPASAPTAVVSSVLPQRRPRQSRPPPTRRRQASSGIRFATSPSSQGWKRATNLGQKASVGDGDDSWEDADDHSDDPSVASPALADDQNNALGVLASKHKEGIALVSEKSDLEANSPPQISGSFHEAEKSDGFSAIESNDSKENSEVNAPLNKMEYAENRASGLDESCPYAQISDEATNLGANTCHGSAFNKSNIIADHTKAEVIEGKCNTYDDLCFNTIIDNDKGILDEEEVKLDDKEGIQSLIDMNKTLSFSSDNTEQKINFQNTLEGINECSRSIVNTQDPNGNECPIITCMMTERNEDGQFVENPSERINFHLKQDTSTSYSSEVSENICDKPSFITESEDACLREIGDSCNKHVTESEEVLGLEKQDPKSTRIDQPILEDMLA